MSKRRQSHPWEHLRRVASRTAALLLLSLLFSPLALAATAQAAQTDSGGLCTAARRGISLALPAVVRISTTYEAQLTYDNTDGSSLVFPLDGGSYALTTTGTGAFISGDGNILTAYHVLNDSQADLNLLLAQAAAPDIAQSLNNTNPTQQVTAADVLTHLMNDPGIWQPSIQPPESSVFFSSQYTGPTTADLLSRLQSFPVTIIAQSSPDQPTSSDLAVLHMSGFHDLPTIPLGDSSQVYQGDTLTIIGYPASADLAATDSPINPNNFITASVNSVTVSAFKTTASGQEAIQIDGNIESGDSGGPALNADGQIVGVVSFAAAAPNGSSQTDFLSTVNEAKTLIHEQISINPSLAPDTFDQRWAAAYDACSSTAPGHWHDAYTQFAQIARLYPDFKGVQPYLNYTKAQAAHEPSSNQNSVLPGWAVILIAALALAAVVLSLLLLRRRALSARAGAAYAGYGPGLNRGAPYNTAASSLGTQPTLTPQPPQAQVAAAVQPASASTSAPGSSQPALASETNEQASS